MQSSEYLESSKQRQIFENHRSNFISFLMQQKLYFTLAMLNRCSLEYAPNLPYPGAVAMSNSCGEILIKILIGKHFMHDSDFFNFLVLHEIRHIHQVASFNKSANSHERKIMNIAMDIALHEDLAKLLPKTIAKLLNKDLNPCTPCVRTNTLPDSLPDMDFMYYYNELKKKQDKDQKELPSEMDSHDFDIDNMTDEEKELLTRTVQAAQSEGLRESQRIGTGHGEESMSVKRSQIPEAIKNALRALKVKTTSLSNAKIKPNVCWTRPARHTVGLPGTVYQKIPVLQVIALIDVSGSMFNQDTQNILFTSCKLLESQGKLRAAYMFDTKIMRLDLDKSKVMGGGGTAITQEMIQQVKDENPGKIEFVLLSDMEIMWSEKVRASEKIHMIEIHP